MERDKLSDAANKPKWWGSTEQRRYISLLTIGNFCVIWVILCILLSKDINRLIGSPNWKRWNEVRILTWGSAVPQAKAMHFFLISPAEGELKITSFVPTFVRLRRTTILSISQHSFTFKAPRLRFIARENNLLQDLIVSSPLRNFDSLIWYEKAILAMTSDLFSSLSSPFK